MAEVIADRGLTIERMVKPAQVSRAGYCRLEESARSGLKPDMELRDAANRAGMAELRATLDHLWVADITCARLREEFVFLAVVLDAYSRRVIGWAPDRVSRSRLHRRFVIP